MVVGMNSMTGYGRADATDGNLKVVVEIQSVNRRQSDIVVSLPRGFDGLEAELRKPLAAAVSRGRVSVRFQIEDLSGRVVAQQFNAEAAGRHLDQLRQFATAHNLDHGITLGEIARLPGVFESAGASLDPMDFLPVFQQALESGLTVFLESRRSEGAHIQAVLEASVNRMKDLTSEIRKRAPEVIEHHRKQLQERIRKAGLEPEHVDPSRLAQELILIADRCDVTEELDRLDHHFQKFEKCLKSDSSQGRTLDFLAQEMFREINTTGSKANDAGLSDLVVQFKTELEKFREQAQNAE